MPEQWNNFFVMVGGGAAALAGLIFVAMSINHEIIIRNTTHKNRAINMLTGFTRNDSIPISTMSPTAFNQKKA